MVDCDARAANRDLHQRIIPQAVEVDEAECDASEQRRVWATSRQMDTGPRDVLDHARPDLDQALPDGRELALGKRARLSIFSARGRPAA
jgi:hypothetical protein